VTSIYCSASFQRYCLSERTLFSVSGVDGSDTPREKFCEDGSDVWEKETGELPPESILVVSIVELDQTNNGEGTALSDMSGVDCEIDKNIKCVSPPAEWPENRRIQPTSSH
jgi:hypothetical protein